jgi:hypothetical protein
MRKYPPTLRIHASPRVQERQVRCVGDDAVTRLITCISAGKSVFNFCHSLSTYFASLRCPMSLIRYRKLRYGFQDPLSCKFHQINLMILTVRIEIFNSKTPFVHVYSAQTNFREQTWPTITLSRLKKTLTD